jgi:hypothetical protein
MRVWKRMRLTMSAGGRKLWDKRIERVFRKGFATSGSTGFAAKFVIPWLMWFVGFDIKAWASSGFSHEYIAQNSQIIERSAWWFRRLFPGILAPIAGVPPNQTGPEFYSVEFYETILKEIFLDPEFGQTNYFYRFYYEKRYKDQSCCPRTLQEKYLAHCVKMPHALNGIMLPSKKRWNGYDRAHLRN